MATTSEDRQWMERALRFARRGRDSVSPNPMVGAVVVTSEGRSYAGWHRRFGGHHAEVEALEKAGQEARGATLYVTLEPCNHSAKTPPCVQAIVTAGIRRVVVAMADPNGSVRGGGIGQLRRAGVRVDSPFLELHARALNETYLTHVATGRPFTYLKWAATVDGRIATKSGHSRWISGDEARTWGHRQRFWADAILVGIGTVLADDPLLTARLPRRREKPIRRIVLDSELRTPTSARLLGDGSGEVLVYCGRGASQRRTATLERNGCSVVPVAFERRSGLRLEAVLGDLAERGVGRLLIDGGSRVAASFLRAGLVDRVGVVLAPMVLGSDAVAAVADLGIERLTLAPRLTLERTRRLGDDLLIELSGPKG